MLREFREFAIKGNVVDMGVGIVIGAAFTSIVNSFVADVVTPLLGLFTGGIDFSGLYLNLSGEAVESAAQAKERGLAVVSYGLFLDAVLSFLIVAWVLFLVIRSVNALRRRAEPETLAPRDAPADLPPPSAEVQLLAEIRDLLRERGGP
ncbi:MAG: large-conductance mechanosensitive channel protein MscL [Paracoccaceae bacterium]